MKEICTGKYKLSTSSLNLALCFCGSLSKLLLSYYQMLASCNIVIMKNVVSDGASSFLLGYCPVFLCYYLVSCVCLSDFGNLRLNPLKGYKIDMKPFKFYTRTVHTLDNRRQF